MADDRKTLTEAETALVLHAVRHLIGTTILEGCPLPEDQVETARALVKRLERSEADG